jgi:hypothetical protein
LPHTLQATTTVTGEGTWEPGVNADVLYITVLDRGNSRELDVGADPRLFQLGWFAIANQLPLDIPPLYFHEPIWIVWDKQMLNLLPFIQSTNVNFGVDGVHYRLLEGAEVQFDIYTFST